MFAGNFANPKVMLTWRVHWFLSEIKAGHWFINWYIFTDIISDYFTDSNLESRTLYCKSVYPQLLKSYVNSIQLFFSVYYRKYILLSKWQKKGVLIPSGYQFKKNNRLFRKSPLPESESVKIYWLPVKFDWFK